MGTSFRWTPGCQDTSCSHRATLSKSKLCSVEQLCYIIPALIVVHLGVLYWHASVCQCVGESKMERVE